MTYTIPGERVSYSDELSSKCIQILSSKIPPAPPANSESDSSASSFQSLARTSSSSRHQKGLLRRHNQQQHANRLWVTYYLMCPALQHVLHPEGTVWEAFQHTRSSNNETKEFQPEGKWQHQEDTQTTEVIDSVHKRRAVSLGRNERPCPLFPANMTKPTVVTTNAAGKISSESDCETHQS